MLNNPNGGYREIEHTADWELHVWGADMPTLMAKAAEGMYTLLGIRLDENLRLSRQFEVHLMDRESALVDFLTELVFIGEHERIGFDQFSIDACGDCYQIQASGAQIESQTKEIKAVTYHNLQVRETEKGLEVNIVFDV